MEAITATKAVRDFFQVIKRVELGETFVITRRGREVAKIEPNLELEKTGLPDLTAFRASIGNMRKSAPATKKLRPRKSH